MHINLQSDYRGYIVTAAKGWKSGWRFRWRGRVYTIDNDDISVDVNDRVSIAGPHAGQTYEDVYGRNFDFLRQSALDRDAFESKADLSYRFGKKTGTLRFLWEYDTIDRENFQVMLGEFKTTTNMLGVNYRSRPATGWNLEANLKYADVNNAFMLIDGSCSTLVSGAYPNPWNPETPQYTDFHNARIAELHGLSVELGKGGPPSRILDRQDHRLRQVHLLRRRQQRRRPDRLGPPEQYRSGHDLVGPGRKLELVRNLHLDDVGPGCARVHPGFRLLSRHDYGRPGWLLS